MERSHKPYTVRQHLLGVYERIDRVSQEKAATMVADMQLTRYVMRLLEQTTTEDVGTDPRMSI
jgi:hypothetical protein